MNRDKPLFAVYKNKSVPNHENLTFKKTDLGKRQKSTFDSVTKSKDLYRYYYYFVIL